MAKVLVVNAFEKSHNTHFNLEEALDFIALVKPESITHISHLLGFHEEVQNNYLQCFPCI
jgi:phosphoribosyl 1,2-cyclic phosphate phosphodiesterase